MRKAFTLVELLITVSILTLVVAFSVPTYQLILAQVQLTSAANQLADFLIYSQQRTVTEQLLYGVTFTSGASTVPQYLYTPAAPGGSATKTQMTPYTFPTNITIGQVNFGGQADVRFSTSAAPNVSGNVVLYDSIRSRSRRVTISPAGLVSANEAEF